MEPEVNLHDVISRMLGTNVGQSRRLHKIVEPNLVKKQTTIKVQRAKFTYSHFSKSKMMATAILNFENVYLQIGWKNLVNRCIIAIWR